MVELAHNVDRRSKCIPPFLVQAQNLVLREAGTRSAPEPWMRSHPELLTMLGIVNLEAGQAAAGGRGYYLLGQGVLLNQVGRLAGQRAGGATTGRAADPGVGAGEAC